MSTAPIGSNGVLRITLHDLLRRPGATGPAHDVTFEARRRDSVWDRECFADAHTYNASLHDFRVRRAEDDKVWRFDGRIDPDPWVSGGVLKVTVRLDKTEGTYEGAFTDIPVSGRVTTRFEEKPRPSRGRVAASLRILSEFERAGAASRLYDFSSAGYRYGEQPPEHPGLPVFRAADFGARADSGEEAGGGIQAAIDAAAAAGGGIVRLDPGVYDVRVDAWRDPIRIASSNIVLRGAGSGPDGTLIVNHRYADSPEPAKPWLAGQWPILLAGGTGVAEGRAPVRVRSARRGEREIEVENPSSLAVGQTYELDHLETEQGTLIRALVGDACKPAANYVGKGVPLVSQLVTVTAIEGERVTLDLPLHWALSERWTAELKPVSLLSGIGVEHLRMRSHWADYFLHHRSPEHDNGWDHIGLNWIAHSWVRDVLSENATSSIGMGNTKNCTLSDCRITGNPGHNGYCVGGIATANLLTRLDCERPMHAFNLAGRICGNVIHDCRISEPGGVDLHGGTGLDNLIDRLTGGVLVGGGSDKAVPPRHGPGLVMWNWCQGHYDPYQAWRRVERIATWRETPGFIAVGVHGLDGHRCRYECRDGFAHEDRFADDAWIESGNQSVLPSSLYRHQRTRRV